MPASKNSKSKVWINGSVCYLGQNPWMFNGTVKENIVMNKKFNQRQFDRAIKYSALDLDLKTWTDKENHEIGENGTMLSGGQRARVGLARCLYQE
jgi:ABC-type transport system involved in cytochrome bd biosynthesis fused ATPase/permease subunit